MLEHEKTLQKLKVRAAASPCECEAVWRQGSIFQVALPVASIQLARRRHCILRVPTGAYIFHDEFAPFALEDRLDLRLQQ